jgi:hypothetical protein
VPENASERKRECDDGKRAANHQNNQHQFAEEALPGFNWRLDDPSVSLFHLCLRCQRKRLNAGLGSELVNRTEAAALRQLCREKNMISFEVARERRQPDLRRARHHMQCML